MLGSLLFVGIYVVLVGVASFIEAPLGRGLRSVELNFLIRAGSLAAAVVALVATHGLALPGGAWVAGAIGIGLLTGAGSIVYCVALVRLPIAVVVTLSNLYLVVTVTLGIVLLREPMAVTTIAGLACTLGGVALLARPPSSRYSVHSAMSVAAKPPGAAAFVPMAVYVVIVGVGAFLEKPALEKLDPTELNGLVAVGMTLVATVMLAREGPRLSMTRSRWLVAGVGLMIGVASIAYFLGLRGLPVTVAAATSNSNVLVTVALAALFQGQRITAQGAIAMALTLAGVTLLAASAA